MTIQEIEPRYKIGPINIDERVIRELDYGDRVALGIRQDTVSGRREFIVGEYIGLDNLSLIRIDGNGKQIFDLTPGDILRAEGLLFDVSKNGIGRNRWTRGKLKYVPNAERTLREEKEKSRRHWRSLVESCLYSIKESTQK